MMKRLGEIVEVLYTWGLILSVVLFIVVVTGRLLFDWPPVYETPVWVHARESIMKTIAEQEAERAAQPTAEELKQAAFNAKVRELNVLADKIYRASADIVQPTPYGQ